MRKGIPFTISHVLSLCVVVFAVSAFFISDEGHVGYILVALGLLCLASVKPFGVTIASLGPDIAFGVIDNGVLAVLAVVGGRIAGVPGAIIGGVVGNALTDGIAGIFEGYWAESIVEDRRTILGSAVGKMAGCLLGAGGVLIMLGLL